MAQSALTVTTPNPTPPTNMAFTGTTGPNPPNYRRNTYDNPFNLDANKAPQSPYGVNPNPPPYFDDAAGGVALQRPGTGAVLPAFKTNTAALTAGTTANDTGTGTTISTAATGAGGTGVIQRGRDVSGHGDAAHRRVRRRGGPGQHQRCGRGRGHRGGGAEDLRRHGERLQPQHVPAVQRHGRRHRRGGDGHVADGDVRARGLRLAAPSVGAGPVNPNRTHASSTLAHDQPDHQRDTGNDVVAGHDRVGHQHVRIDGDGRRLHPAVRRLHRRHPADDCLRLVNKLDGGGGAEEGDGGHAGGERGDGRCRCDRQQRRS